MLECGLSNGLDSTGDDGFRRRRQWNNHRDWHGCDSENEHTEVHVEWWSIWRTISRKRVLIESGIQVAESTWNRISTPERAKWTNMVRWERDRKVHNSLLFTCWPPGPRACRWLISSLSIQSRSFCDRTSFSSAHTYWNIAIEFFAASGFFRRLNRCWLANRRDWRDDELTDLIGPVTLSSELHLGNSLS